MGLMASKGNYLKNAILPIVFLLVSQLSLDELAVQAGDVGD